MMILLVMCNIRSPAMRKQTVSDDILALASSFFIFIFLFTLTWSFSPLAYINFPGQEIPEFYPLFQILNSFLGIFFFCCLGIGSQRFRAVITRKVPRKVYQVQLEIFWNIHNLTFNFPLQTPPKIVIGGECKNYDVLEQDELDDEETDDEDEEANIGSSTSLTRSRPGSGTASQMSTLDEENSSEEDRDGSDDQNNAEKSKKWLSEIKQYP